MGTLGLYDEDAERYVHTVFNLEIMKLSSYYKRKREIVTMAPSFCPDKYTNFIYRKDYNDGEFPANLTKISNLQYGGLAFSNNRYIALPEEIECRVPDTSIYDFLKTRFCSSREKEELFRSMRTAAHLRLSLDGNTLWDKVDKQLGEINKKSILFIHDYTLGSINEDFEYVKEVLKQMRTAPIQPRIAAKFPIYITSGEQMLKWASLESSTQFFTLYYDGIMEDELLYELIQSGYGFGKKLEYDITNSCYDEKFFFEEVLPKIFRQIIFSRSHLTKISLKYDDDFFKLKGWKEIIDLFNSFAVSLFDSVSSEKLQKILADDSMYSFVKNLPEKAILKTFVTDRERARKVFSLIRDKNYELFADFYECHQVQYKGGKFVNA